MAKLKKKRKTWTMADVEAGLVTTDGKILKPKDPRTDSGLAQPKDLLKDVKPPVKEEKAPAAPKPRTQPRAPKE